METEETPLSPPPGLSIIPQVTLTRSGIEPSTLGIFCKDGIALGQQFGPFEGEKVQEAHSGMDPCYVWEIVDLESKEHLWYIDATDPSKGNWMRYIKSARFYEEQNIVSEQVGTDILYKAIKDIPPGDELLTWFEKVQLKGTRRKRKLHTAVKPTPGRLSRSPSEENTKDTPANENEEEYIPPKKLSRANSRSETARSRRSLKSREITKDKTAENGSEFDASLDSHQNSLNGEDSSVNKDKIKDEDNTTTHSMDPTSPDCTESETGYYQFELKADQEVKNSLGKKVYKCDICSGVYRHSFSLKRHYIRTHINPAYLQTADRLNCCIQGDLRGGKAGEGEERPAEDREGADRSKEAGHPGKDRVDENKRENSRDGLNNQLEEGDDKVNVERKEETEGGNNVAKMIDGDMLNVEGKEENKDNRVIGVRRRNISEDNTIKEGVNLDKCEEKDGNLVAGEKGVEDVQGKGEMTGMDSVKQDTSECLNVKEGTGGAFREEKGVNSRDEERCEVMTGEGSVSEEGGIGTKKLNNAAGNGDDTQSIEALDDKLEKDNRNIMGMETNEKNWSKDIGIHESGLEDAEGRQRSKPRDKREEVTERGTCTVSGEKGESQTNEDSEDAKKNCQQFNIEIKTQGEIQGHLNRKEYVNGKHAVDVIGERERISEENGHIESDKDKNSKDADQVDQADQSRHQESETVLCKEEVTGQQAGFTTAQVEPTCLSSVKKGITVPACLESGEKSDCILKESQKTNIIDESDKTNCDGLLDKKNCGNGKVSDVRLNDSYPEICKIHSGSDVSPDKTLNLLDNIQDITPDTSAKTQDNRSTGGKMGDNTGFKITAPCHNTEISSSGTEVACMTNACHKQGVDREFELNNSRQHILNLSDNIQGNNNECVVYNTGCILKTSPSDDTLQELSNKNLKLDKRDEMCSTVLIEKDESKTGHLKGINHTDVTASNETVKSKNKSQECSSSNDSGRHVTISNSSDVSPATGHNKLQPQSDSEQVSNDDSPAKKASLTEQSSRNVLCTEQSKIEPFKPNVVNSKDVLTTCMDKISGSTHEEDNRSIAEKGSCSTVQSVPEGDQLMPAVKEEPIETSPGKDDVQTVNGLFKKTNKENNAIVTTKTEPSADSDEMPGLTDQDKDEPSGNSDEMPRLIDERKESQVESLKEVTNDDSTECADERSRSTKGGPRTLVGLYRCNMCEDLFNSASQLKLHIRNHPRSSEQAMWSCDMCDMKFKQKKCLMRHQAVHSKKGTGKSRNCRHCGSYFASMKYLKRHERLHESVRHTCEHCATSFSQAPDLKKHIRRTHPTCFHPCAYCPDYFSGKRGLHGHLQDSHQKAPKDNKREAARQRREETHVIDPEVDRAESLRVAREKQGGRDGTEGGEHRNKYACTVCKKLFLDYTNMCRHRSLAHQRHLLEVVRTKTKPRYSIMNTQTSIIRTRAAAERDSEEFFTNIGRNVRDNLNNHMMGTFQMISHADEIIKWDVKRCKGSSFDATFPKKDKNSFVLPVSVLSRSNFPKSFRMWDPWNKYRPTSRGAACRSYSLLSHGPGSDIEDEDAKDEAWKVPDSGIATRIEGIDVIGCQLCHSVFHEQADFEDHVREAHPLHPVTTCRSPLPVKSNTDIHLPISLQYTKLEQDQVVDLSQQAGVGGPRGGRGEDKQNKAGVECTDTLGLVSSEQNKVTPKPTGPAVCTDDPGERFQRFLCKACYQEFADWQCLKTHKEQVHPTIEFDYTVVDHSLKQVWYNQPKPAGMLNVTATMLPSHDVLSCRPYKCTKCGKRQKDLSELHAHIIDCADPESLRPKYVWVYQYRKHRYSKMKQKRTCEWQKNTPRKAMATADFSLGQVSDQAANDKSDSLLGNSDFGNSSFDLFDEVKKRRRRPFELLYNPNRHTRRREMAEVVTTAICSGCDVDYKTISMLERHIPSCSHKEKIRELESMKPMYGPDSSDSSDTEDYDPYKHLCIYCLRQFTYLGSLRNHIYEICTVRREFVKQGEYLDEEWEEELIKKTGGRKEPLSRHSSLSSIAGNLEEDNSQDSTDTKKSIERLSDSERKVRRKRRGFGWAQKNKGGNFTKTVKRVESRDGYVYEYYIESEIPVVSFDISDTFILDSDKPTTPTGSPLKTPSKGTSLPSHRPAPYVHQSSYHDDNLTAQDLSKNGASNESPAKNAKGKKEKKVVEEIKTKAVEIVEYPEIKAKEKRKKGFIRGPYKKKNKNKKDLAGKATKKRAYMHRSISANTRRGMRNRNRDKSADQEIHHSQKLSRKPLQKRKYKTGKNITEPETPKRKYRKRQMDSILVDIDILDIVENKKEIPLRKRKYQRQQVKAGVSLTQRNTEHMVDLSKKRSIKDILKSKKSSKAVVLERALVKESTSKTVKKCLKERITQKKLAERKLKNNMTKSSGLTRLNGQKKHGAFGKIRKKETAGKKSKPEIESESGKFQNESEEGKLWTKGQSVKWISHNQNESELKKGKPKTDIESVNGNSSHELKNEKVKELCYDSKILKGKLWSKTETKKGKLERKTANESTKLKPWKKKSVSSFTLVSGIHINKGKTVPKHGEKGKEDAKNCWKPPVPNDRVNDERIGQTLQIGGGQTGNNMEVDIVPKKRKYCKKVPTQSASSDFSKEADRSYKKVINNEQPSPVISKKPDKIKTPGTPPTCKNRPPVSPQLSPTHYSALSPGGTPCDQIINHLFLNSTLSPSHTVGGCKTSPPAGSLSAPGNLAYGRGAISPNSSRIQENPAGRGIGSHGKAKRVLEL